MKKNIMDIPARPGIGLFLLLSFSVACLFAACKKNSSTAKSVITQNQVASLNCDIVVTTLAGTGIPGYVNGPANLAQFFYPYGICLKQGASYVTEYSDQRIRAISLTAMVSTFASTPGGVYAFLQPHDICYSPISNCFYVTDYNRILKVDSVGTVSVFAGYFNPGYVDHTSPHRARFNDPEGICVDNSGNIYVVDRGNHCIRKILTSGQVITLAGTGTVPGYLNGPGPVAKFNLPSEICYRASDNCLYVTDDGNNRIRKIQMNGTTSPFAGSGLAGDQGGGISVARFAGLRGIAVDLTGDWIVVQAIGSPLRMISGSMVSTLVPDNGAGYTNGSPAVAQFNGPKHIVVNSANQYLITDFTNHVIRRVSCQ